MKDRLGRVFVGDPGNSSVLRVRLGIIVSRKCSVCRQFKDIADFEIWTDHFHGRSWYSRVCQECKDKFDRAKSSKVKYRSTRRSKDGRLELICTRCNRYKDRTEFYYDKATNRYRSWCIRCYNQERRRKYLETGR